MTVGRGGIDQPDNNTVRCNHQNTLCLGPYLQTEERWLVNVGPASGTTGQHYPDIGLTSSV